MSEADALLDLRERIVDGAARLRNEAMNTTGVESARLIAKAEGLEVALDYTRHALSLAER